MVHIIWDFTVRAEKIRGFERHYSSAGSWAALFARSRGFRGTHLLRDTEHPRRFLTVDAWDDLAAFQSFREQHAADYDALDRVCESFTESEHRIGVFGVQ